MNPTGTGTGPPQAAYITGAIYPLDGGRTAI
jgi:hypothetical protein